MPRIYGVGNGAGLDAGPRTERGEGLRVSFHDLQSIFGDHPPLWVGDTPPSLASKLRWGQVAHVLVEVLPEDGINATFDRPGFYRLPDLSPARAEGMLKEARRM